MQNAIQKPIGRMSAFQVQCTLSPQSLTRPLLLIFTVCSSLSFLHSPFTLFSWGRQFATSLRTSSPRMPMTLTDNDFPKFRVREVATLATIVASFPGLPCFCVHNNTREWKWGRPRSIHHMKDVRWMRGGHRGRARYSNIYLLDLKASFLLVKASRFEPITLRSRVQSSGRALKWIIQYVLLVVGPSPFFAGLPLPCVQQASPGNEATTTVSAGGGAKGSGESGLLSWSQLQQQVSHSITAKQSIWLFMPAGHNN